MQDLDELYNSEPSSPKGINIEEESEFLNYIGLNTLTSKELSDVEQKFNLFDIKEKPLEDDKLSHFSNKSTGFSNKSSTARRQTNEYKKASAFDSTLKFKPETLLLNLFKRKKSNKPPKKEYIRCTLIRGHKRSIRQSFQGVYPSKGIHKFLLTDFESCKIWNFLTQICHKDVRDAELMMAKSSTVKGPKTDGKSKRQKFAVKEEVKKSFNDDFCRSYFLEDIIKEHYYYYIELLFLHFDCDILCEKFNFMCCEGKNHTEICYKKWEMMRIFISDYMLSDIKIDPWFPSGYDRQKLTLEVIDELSKVVTCKEESSDEDISCYLALEQI